MYWNPEYLKLKDSLRKSEALTGVLRSEEHTNKINKNPEKIRKTAEAHRGMKRSAEARRKMSEAAKGRTAKNKGKKVYYNPNNPSEIVTCTPEERPEGWINGVPKAKRANVS